MPRCDPRHNCTKIRYFVMAITSVGTFLLHQRCKFHNVAIPSLAKGRDLKVCAGPCGLKMRCQTFQTLLRVSAACLGGGKRWTFAPPPSHMRDCNSQGARRTMMQEQRAIANNKQLICWFIWSPRC